MILLSGYRGLAETFLSTFNKAGHSVSVLVKREAAIPELQNRFPLVQFVPGDISSRSDGNNWINTALSRFKKIDVLVNNAAITGPTGKWHEIDFAEAETSLSVNLVGPLYLTQLCLKHFAKQGSGTVLNLSGGGATAARPHFISYAIAKSALVRATESLAKEYPELRFYAISPGALKTQMTQAILDQDKTQVGPEYGDLKRRIDAGGEDPQKAAALALWLIENNPKELSGKLISGIWDNYKDPKSWHRTDWWTLRRVDEVLWKKLQEEQL